MIKPHRRRYPHLAWKPKLSQLLIWESATVFRVVHSDEKVRYCLIVRLADGSSVNTAGDRVDLGAYWRRLTSYKRATARALSAREGRPLNYDVEVLDRFLETLDQRALEVARRYKRRSWLVYSVLCSIGDRAYQLEQSNSALFWAICNAKELTGRKVGWEMRRRRGLINSPRRRALANLGFPGTRSVERILRRVPRPSLNRIGILRDLRLVLSSAGIEHFRHQDRINAGVIALVSTSVSRKSFSANLLREIGLNRRFDGRRYSEPADLMRVTLSLLPPAKRDRITIKSTSHLMKLHRTLLKCAEFPLPPLSSPPAGLTYLGSAQAHHDWGEFQQNCLRHANRARQALNGSLYVYSVEFHGHPSATLALVKGNDGEVSIGEFETASREVPCDACHEIIYGWLEKQGHKVAQRSREFSSTTAVIRPEGNDFYLPF